ncbi:MAG: hypothetical protein AB7E76_04255 [Deferribacterales bacterium]
MQTKIEDFIHDLYADIDSGEDAKYIAGKYFTEAAVLVHYGAVHKGADAVAEWCGALQSGYDNSVHRVKGVDCAQFPDVIAVQADTIWTAGYKNMPGKNMIMHKTVVRMDIVEDGGFYKIKNYISKVVG